MLDKFVNPLTLLSGPVSVIALCFTAYHLPSWDIIISYVVWLLATRIVKLSPHLFRRPQDIIHVPAFLLFNFYFAFMKIYALFTLNVTGWGTRQGVGNELAADIERNAVAASIDETSQTTIEISPEVAVQDKFIAKLDTKDMMVTDRAKAHVIVPAVPIIPLETAPVMIA